MFAAVALRQQLVGMGLAEEDAMMLKSLEVIKQRALLSNLLVSRDLDNLEEQMSLMTLPDDMNMNGSASIEDEDRGSLAHLAQDCALELNAARDLLADSASSRAHLKEAIKSRDTDNLCSALAFAAYHQLQSDEADMALKVLMDVNNRPTVLLMPLIEAIRRGKEEGIHLSMQAINKATSMGWLYTGIEIPIVTAIIRMDEQMEKDDQVRQKLIALALGIKNKFNIEKPGDALQLLRRAYTIGLQKDLTMVGYIAVVEQKLKQFSSLLRLEKSIQTMLVEKDIEV